MFMLDNPRRVVIDIKDSEFNDDFLGLDIRDGRTEIENEANMIRCSPHPDFIDTSCIRYGNKRHSHQGSK
jgi:hypothetical protein